MEASPLRVIQGGPDLKATARDVAKGTLLVIDPATGNAELEASDLIVGLLKTIESQGRQIGSLSRQIEEESNPDLERNGSARGVATRWKTATGKERAMIGKPRIKLVNAAHGWGFPYDSEDPLPDHATLTLAVDGVAAYPWRLFSRRYRDGEQPKGAERDDDLSDALKDEKHVEKAARLGYAARKQGWTPEKGWPQREEQE